MGAAANNVCVLLLTGLVILCLATTVSGRRPSNYCYEDVNVMRSRKVGFYYTTVCSRSVRDGSFRRGWRCVYRYKLEYYLCTKYTTSTYYYYETVKRKKCCDGYRGCYCHIPICPGCQNGGFCTAPNTCTCPTGSTGDRCELKVCDAANIDCYPGTCAPNGACVCSSGNTGDNCLTISGSGTLRTCNFEIQDQNYNVQFSEPCGVDDNGITYQYYSNVSYPYWLVANYEVYYEISEDRPPYPSWITEAAIGLISSGIQPTLTDESGNQKWSASDISCNVATSQKRPDRDNPYQTLNCDDTKQRWPEKLEHSYKLSLTINSVSGGFKNYVYQGTPRKEYYSGTEFDEPVMDIVFDFEPPKHCSETKNCVEQNISPCTFYPQIHRGSDQVSLEWNGWNDTDSGLGTFTYTVHRMQLDDIGQLVQGDVVIPRTEWPGDTLPEITLTTSGMYSAILEVSDQAGNIVKSRGLLLYDRNSTIEILQDKPLDITGTVLVGNIYWLALDRSSLELRWSERYINKFLHDNKLLSGVSSIPGVMDDELGTFVKGQPNVQGITRFGIYISENDQIPDEDQYENVNIDSPSYSTNEPLADGDVRYVFILAADILGNSEAEIITVGVDSSPAGIIKGEIEFFKNEASTVLDFPYASRVAIPIVDGESGILFINFTVIDYTSGTDLIVKDSSQQGQKHAQYTNAEGCALSGECYCAAVGGCFTSIQDVWLNNCWFDGLDGHVFRLDFTVINGAGMETDDNYNIHVFDRIEGLGIYPPPSRLRHITHSDNVYKITLSWEYPASCYEPEKIHYTYTTHVQTYQDSVAAESMILEIDGLRPSTDYTVEMYMTYGEHTSDPVTIQFTTLSDGFDPDALAKQTDKGGIGTGALVGIIVVSLIVVVLLAGVIILLVRRKQHKPMIPHVVASAGRSIRRRLSRHGGQASHHATVNDYGQEQPINMHVNAGYEGRGYKGTPYDNPPPYQPATIINQKPMRREQQSFKVAYVGEEDEAIYTYGHMDTEDNAAWKVSNDRLIMGESLPKDKGRFADLKLATMQTNSGAKTVVAKMNKVGASDKEKLLMTAKMNFLATGVPENDNILQFVGAIPAPQGPIILMEYCEGGKLSDWLKNQNISDEVQDLMVNFSIQVAAGMGHLHNAEILHRRLGARNILLTKNMSNQLVAKVTGFGPMKGEQDGKSGNSKGDKVPFKWMAPEQFEVQHQGRIYTPKTDVWSYGILLHEIFSKGGQPYPGMSLTDVTNKVSKGYRMEKAAFCPDFVYEEIMVMCWKHTPEERPDFDIIITGMKRYFESGVTQEDYAYDTK